MKKNEILSEEIAGEHMSGNGFDLIRIQTNENEEQVVSGRELHEFLEVKTKYVDWIDRKIKKYGFAENRDFVAISQKREVANGGKNRWKFNHGRTPCMASHHNIHVLRLLFHNNSIERKADK